MDGIKAAFERMPKREAEEESNDTSNSGGEHESSEGELHSVLHAKHGDKHSVHKIHESGKAESSMHDAGKGDDCPLCD